MRPLPTTPTRPSPAKGGWLRRFGWLLLIWCASVAALGVAATLLKLLMHAIGMSS